MSPINHANISYSCNKLCFDETTNVLFLSYIKAETKKMAECQRAEDSSTPGIYVLCVSTVSIYITFITRRKKKDAGAIIKATLEYYHYEIHHTSQKK